MLTKEELEEILHLLVEIEEKWGDDYSMNIDLINRIRILIIKGLQMNDIGQGTKTKRNL